MAPRTLKGRVTGIVQTSPLLALPPELRNTIYEYVASNTNSIAITKYEIFCVTPMQAVCQQIREEYEGVYATEAPRYAQHVSIDIDNFNHADASWAALHTLPALASRASRTFELRITLTNTFDTYLSGLRALIGGIKTGEVDAAGEDIRLDFEYVVLFDHKTFDVEYLRPMMEKFRVAFTEPNMYSDKWCQWQKIEKALVRAIERFDASVGPKKPVKRSRKRQGGSKGVVELAVTKRAKRQRR